MELRPPRSVEVINQDPKTYQKTKVFIRRESTLLEKVIVIKYNITPNYYSLNLGKPECKARVIEELSYRIRRYPQSSHVQQMPCTTWAQRPQAAERKSQANIKGEDISRWMTGGTIRAERKKSSATGRSSSPAVGGWFPHTSSSLAEASALQAVACLVCSGHQGLGKAAVGKDGAVR